MYVSIIFKGGKFSNWEFVIWSIFNVIDDKYCKFLLSFCHLANFSYFVAINAKGGDCSQLALCNDLYVMM